MLEKRLRRAGVLIDQLIAESPDDADYAHAAIHVQAKLGMTLQRLKRIEEAEACYRRAIALEESRLAQSLPTAARRSTARPRGMPWRHSCSNAGKETRLSVQLKTAADELGIADENMIE